MTATDGATGGTPSAHDRVDPATAPSPDAMEQLERVAALGWRGLQEERLGDWLLRAGGGFTGRANSALPLGSPGLELPTAFDRIRDWYADRDLPAILQVPLPLRSDVDVELERAGWTPYNLTHILTATVADLLRLTPTRPDLPPVRHAAGPSPDWLDTYHYRGSALPPGAAAVMLRGNAPTFASVEEGGRTTAVARGVVDEGWLGVTAVTVRDDQRRRGLATHVMRALGEWAAERGATQVYLQVAVENTPALAMYAGQGFTCHHDYRYRVAP